MGLLDDILNSAPSGQGMGLLSYLNGALTSIPPVTDAPDTKRQANDLAAALGINSIDQAARQAALNANVPAASAPGAPSVPLSTDNNSSPLVTPPAAPIVPTFGAGALPTLFVNPPGSTPGNPALPASVATSPSAAPATPPIVAQDDEDERPAAAPNPPSNAPIAVGNYQMPRIGSGFSTAPAAAPMQVTPSIPNSAPANPVSNFFNRLADGLQSISRGGSLTDAIRGQYSDPKSLAAQQQNLTVRALVAKDVAPAIAIAAVQPGNTELLKTLIDQKFGPQTVQNLGSGYVADKNGNVTRAYEPDDTLQLVQTGQDGMGGKTYGVFNKSTGEIKPYTAPGSASATGPGIGDMTKTGADYLATIPQDKQGVLKGMIDGTIQPPSSFAASKPYWQNMIAAAKHLDPTWDENNWAGRHKMNVDLASSSNSSMGGILSNGASSFSHLAGLSDSMAGLGNASHDYPFGGTVANVENYIGNASPIATSATKAKIKAINDNLGHYGQESTKFYSGTGGGAEERMNALKEVNPNTTSSEEMAAYVEKEKALMLDRLQNKFNQIRDVYGDDESKRIIARKLPELQKDIRVIDANIAKLRGQEPTSAPTSAPATAVPTTTEAPKGPLGPGNYAWTPGQPLSVVK